MLVAHAHADSFEPPSTSIVSRLTTMARRANPPSLTELMKSTIKNNPDILAARERWLAETQTIPQERALPDPLFNIGIINLQGSNPLEEALQDLSNIGGTQTIPFPGKLYFKGKIASIAAKQANAEYQSTILVILTELKRAYYELYYTNRAIAIYEKNKKILERISRVTQHQYELKQAIQQDVFRAQTEISRMDILIVTALQERQSILADINRILNRDLTIEISTPDVLPVSRLNYTAEQLYEIMRERSPELLVQKRGVEKGKANISLSKMGYFTDLEVTADRLHDAKLHANGYQVFLKASVPLYFMDKQNKAFREATERYQANIEDLQKTYQHLAFIIKNAVLNIHRSAKLIDLLQKTTVPYASLTLAASEAAYQQNQVDFLTYIDNLYALQGDELLLAREMVDNERALTDIEEAVGIFL